VLFALIVTVIFVLMFGGILLFVRSGAYTKTLERTLPKSAGMVLPPENSAEVLGRIVGLTSRYIIVGAVVSVVYTIVVPLALGLGPWDLSGAYVGMAGVIVGLVAGHLNGFARDANRRAANPGPITRPAGVRLSDYLSPFTLVAAAIVAVIALGSLILAIYVIVSDFEFDYERAIFSSPIASSVAYASTFVALIVYVVGIAVILRRPQNASSNIALAWDDALTSQLMFSGLYITCFIIGISTNPLYSALVQQVPGGGDTDGLRTLLFAGALLLPLTIFGVVLASVLTKPTKRYIKRLWPSLAR